MLENYTFESPDHYFHNEETGIEVDFVELLAEIESSWEVYGMDDYKVYNVTSITWQKSEYTKEENELIKETLDNPEKRKEYEKKILRQFQTEDNDYL